MPSGISTPLMRDCRLAWSPRTCSWPNESCPTPGVRNQGWVNGAGRDIVGGLGGPLRLEAELEGGAGGQHQVGVRALAGRYGHQRGAGLEFWALADQRINARCDAGEHVAPAGVAGRLAGDLAVRRLEPQ